MKGIFIHRWQVAGTFENASRFSNGPFGSCNRQTTITGGMAIGDFGTCFPEKKESDENTNDPLNQQLMEATF